MIEVHPYFDTEGLTKARTEKQCTNRNCRRTIHKGEYYLRYFQRGERLRCTICETKHQIVFHRQRADDLAQWLQEIGE